MNKRLALLVGVLLLLCAAFFYASSWKPLPFDAERWRAARDAAEYKLCYRMRDSLLDKLHKSRPGLKETIVLLGEPDFRATQVECKYKLGSPPFSPTHYWISTAFDSNGDLIRASITAD